MKLIIVESPTKCPTIKNYLGEEYTVVASQGHIRDLATTGKGGLGVDVEHDFKPTYIINKDKYNIVNSLRKETKKADEVILATDPDREGEAIAWHLQQVLKLKPDVKRLEFHEITREAITEAIKHPRTINPNLVSSQEARRILDRIIGFKLSSLIYKKIHSKSAGRVQTATLKMICDHDIEIDKFIPEEYYTISTKGEIFNINYDLIFDSYKGNKDRISTKDLADEIINAIPNELVVTNVSKTIKSKELKEPFRLSTLQQEAFNKLKFGANKTLEVAKTLYEGVVINGKHVGLISYVRTDSSRLSSDYIARASAYIKETYGSEYIGQLKKIKKVNKSQDAHEAVRPTSNHITPDSIKEFLTRDQYELYKLIYNRTLSSVMKPRQDEVMTIELSGGDTKFHVNISRVVFDGYQKLLKEKDDESVQTLPNIENGYIFHVVDKKNEYKTTQPPAHYSEGKLVNKMEDVGIGRPSTYAFTIEILKKRKYISSSGGVLESTLQGRKTAHVLEKYFPNIVSAKYTADMESELDSIEKGDMSSIEVLQKFYNPFIEQLQNATEKMYADDVEPFGDVCPKCGQPLVYKYSKNGRFVGCSNYPTCTYRFDEPVKKCPKCGKGYMVKKKGQYGYFLGCTNYPECKYIEKIKTKGSKKYTYKKIDKKS